MRTLILVLAAIGLAACMTDTYSIDRPAQVSRWMSPSATAYVSMPPDGEHGEYIFPGSGKAVATIVADAFAPHFARIERADAPQTLAAALAQAKEKNAAYLIAPAILNWEDWNTKNSGKSDQVELEIAVIEVATGQIIERGVIRGVNGVPDNASERPWQLLTIPVREYVSSLFL